MKNELDPIKGLMMVLPSLCDDKLHKYRKYFTDFSKSDKSYLKNLELVEKEMDKRGLLNNDIVE